MTQDGQSGHRCWAATDTGLVRSNNEDGFAVSALDGDGQQLHWQGMLPRSDSWALVADGMGGHAAGEVASGLAVATLRRELGQVAGADDLVASIERAHEAIHAAMSGDATLDGMGTTVVGVLLRGALAIVFNVGDSRAYHWSPDGLRQVSEDHVLGRSVLTRCLGGMRRWPKPQPFLKSVELRSGDRLLLCTDGLTDMLFDQEIADLLARPLENPAEALVAAAIEAGGADNVTAIVIEIARASELRSRQPG